MKQKGSCPLNCKLSIYLNREKFGKSCKRTQTLKDLVDIQTF
jgi:hypothetical protein